MRYEKYQITTTQDENGIIRHEYSGKRNISAGEATYHEIDRTDPIADDVRRYHESLLKRMKIVGSVTTKFKTLDKRT